MRRKGIAPLPVNFKRNEKCNLIAKLKWVQRIVIFLK
jgi:hypothetical protein